MPYPGYTGDYPFHGPQVADTDESIMGCAPGTEVAPSPLKHQVAGSHYKQLKIQPVEYINANDLDFLQGNVVKYITRHKNKGRAEDVRKALHFCQLILDMQYGEGSVK